MKRRGPKLKKLSKRQKFLIAEIVETYLYWKNLKKKLQKLFDKARKLKVPITQLAKLIGISKVSILGRYKRSERKSNPKEIKKIYYPNCSTLVVTFDISNPIMMHKVLQDMQKISKIEIHPKPTFDNILKMKEDENYSLSLSDGSHTFELSWVEDHFRIEIGETGEHSEEEVDEFFGLFLKKYSRYITVDQL